MFNKNQRKRKKKR